MKPAVGFLILALVLQCKAEFFVSLTPVDEGLTVLVSRDEALTDVVLTGTLGRTVKFVDGEPQDVSLNVNQKDETVEITWETNNTDLVLKDCFNLNKTNLHWFGGPQRHDNQYWPLEEMSLDANSRPWAVSGKDSFSVIEPYWLNSQGAFIYVDERTPLYVDQNNEEDDKVCFIAKTDGVYVGRSRVLLKYTIGVQSDAKEAHLWAVNNLLGKPTGHPNELMITEPIWTTWATYKKDINDEIVLKFADEIAAQGYHGGQIEIDDDWEVCYGDQTFSTIKFPNITQTVKTLHDMGFRVTLWIHPFVDDTCNPNSDYGKEKGYFVGDKDGNTHASWWNGDNSHQIDFTQEEVQKWFTDRLDKLREEHGIDNFKFDAGESDYASQPNVFPNADLELVPNILSSSYLRTVAQFGDLIEVRSAWKTQDLPIFVRMLDKDSHWGFDNGLRSVITTLLQMNMNGYTMVLPDMVGGNGYGDKPDAELLVRWGQATIFLPAMQFSFLPWEITSDEFDAAALVKNCADLHYQHGPEILAAMNASIENGTPVNAPIWWVDPLNADAQKVNDQYLLGETIMVAPVMDKGSVSRDVYIPTGTWLDGTTGDIIEGPILLTAYNAPIDVLPHFYKQ